MYVIFLYSLAHRSCREILPSFVRGINISTVVALVKVNGPLCLRDEK